MHTLHGLCVYVLVLERVSRNFISTDMSVDTISTYYSYHLILSASVPLTDLWVLHGRDRMVVGFTTTYAISAYHHYRCEFESQSGRGVQHYVIKFVSELRQVGGFLRVLRFPPSIKLTATM